MFLTQGFLPTLSWPSLSRDRSLKKAFLTAILPLGLAISSGSALAHHGWSWTTGENMELTGVIKKVRLGNPHGILDIEVGGERWTIEVGQPWRNQRAGLKDGDLSEGVSSAIQRRTVLSAMPRRWAISLARR